VGGGRVSRVRIFAESGMWPMRAIISFLAFFSFLFFLVFVLAKPLTMSHDDQNNHIQQPTRPPKKKKKKEIFCPMYVGH